MKSALEQEEIELVTRPTRSTQFYLFNLFGDYIVPRGGRIWTNDLIMLLELVGVNEGTARTTLSRMRRQGWFETIRDGRETLYVIAPRGRAILEEGEQRIFAEPLVDWDGTWQMIVYSLPEERRKERNTLRKKLTWFGYGNLAPGTWVSPHKTGPAIAAAAADLGVAQYVTQFSAMTDDNASIIRKCWPLDQLCADYQAFIDKFGPEFGIVRNRQSTLNPKECFVRRFWLTFSFQRFPMKDPYLPLELLPEKWPGIEARQLFTAYRQLLGKGMEQFMDEVVGGC